MEIIATFASVFFLLLMIAPANAQSKTTNHILLNDGIFFGLSDEFAAIPPDNTPLFDKEIFAEKEMFFYLHYPSTNSIIDWSGGDSSERKWIPFFGKERSLAFKLLNSKGEEVPKTARGEALSGHPKSLTDLYANANATGNVRGYILIPGQIQRGYLESPTNLFKFPSNGVYFLEVRYWMWHEDQKKFLLSDPARLRVIKRMLNETRGKL